MYEATSSIHKSRRRCPAPAASSFGGIASQIRGWTTNILATAIVLVVSLVVGWQVSGWWSERPPATIDDPAVQTALRLPEIEGSRQFWTNHGSLQVERIQGDSAAALDAMKTLCRSSTSAPPQNAAGPGEEKFVAKLAAQTPLEERGGVALYQPVNQKSMVVAVNRTSGRVVGWSFALPTEETRWSIYHFRPQAAAAGDEPAALAKTHHE